MFWQGLFASNPFSYWITLLQLLSRKGVVEHYLDVPLTEAVPRSQWATAWSTSLLGVCLLLHFHGAWMHPTLIKSSASRLVVWSTSVGIFLVLLLLAALIGYGFLRLYTLVTHVLTINVFKTRGQRLRLLNVETTLLSLSIPLAGAYMVSLLIPALGQTLIGLICLYLIVLLARSYNTIFHKQRLAGFALLVGGTLVTWFVLAICALAITVTVAVLAFLVLAVLRLTVATGNPP